jgi:hypothetical protein
MKSILTYAKQTPGKTARMHIDIEAWLHSLPGQKRAETRSVILQHAPVVQRAVGEMKGEYTFIIPE